MIQQITSDFSKIKQFSCNLITSYIQYTISIDQTHKAYDIPVNTLKLQAVPEENLLL